MAERTLHLRTDAGPSVGLGHVRRSVALAEAAVAFGFEARWIVPRWVIQMRGLDGAPGHATVLESEPVGAPEPWIAEVDRGDLVWLDGVGARDSVAAECQRLGARVGRIVDNQTGRFVADVLVDPDSTDSQLSAASPGGIVLAGRRYALIRESFRKARTQPRSFEAPVLVAFGGTDVAGLTGPTCERLVAADVPTRALVGPGAPAAEGVECLRYPTDVPGLLATSSAYAGAAGNSLVEACCVGVPAVYTAVAADQHRLAVDLAEHGVGRCIAPDEWLDRVAIEVSRAREPESYRERCENARAAADGMGAHRVLRALVGDVG